MSGITPPNNQNPLPQDSSNQQQLVTEQAQQQEATLKREVIAELTADDLLDSLEVLHNDGMLQQAGIFELFLNSLPPRRG